MKYRVLSGASASSLEEQVEDLLKEGWKLQGGVSTDTMITGVQPSALRGGGNINITQTLFSQAMTLDPVDEVVPESVKEAPSTSCTPTAIPKMTTVNLSSGSRTIVLCR